MKDAEIGSGSLFPEQPQEAASRIDAAICWLLLGHSGGDLDAALDHDEREILRLVRYRRGLAQALAIREIEAKTGLSPRQIKQAVRTLRLNFKLPIGSTKDSTGGGYYVMLTDDDQRAWAKTVLDQIRAEAAVVKAAAGRHRAMEMLGQLTMEMQQ